MYCDAATRGGSGNYAGFTRGSLGTKKNQHGTIVDAARSKAMTARYADEVGGFAGYIEGRALDMASLIPRLVREDIYGDLYGTFFINKNNERLDHTNKSKEEFKKMVENEATGFETRDAKKFDSFLLRIDSEQKEKKKAAKKAGNKKAKKAGNKKKISGVERRNMVHRFIDKKGAMPFAKERFDEKGILDTTEGPKI